MQNGDGLLEAYISEGQQREHVRSREEYFVVLRRNEGYASDSLLGVQADRLARPKQRNDVRYILQLIGIQRTS